MALISKNIDEKASKIREEWKKFQAGQITSTPIASEVGEKSQAAIFAGQGDNPDWVAYMTLFAGEDSDKEANLDKLIPRNGDLDKKRQKARAYLVRNGMCSMGTTDRIGVNVENRLD